MIRYGFFDSLNGDRKYSATDISQLFNGILLDGVFESIGSAFFVTSNSSMIVTVGTGRAWINGTWTNNDSPAAVTPSLSEVALNRIDTVVIEVNTNSAVRANSLKIVKGTPATTPSAPALSNTATLKQFPLADLYIGAGVTQITSANITNRVGSVLSPFVTSPLTTVNIDTLFNNMMDQFTANTDANQLAFDTWFDNLVDQLTTNQATNLQSQITDLPITLKASSAEVATGTVDTKFSTPLAIKNSGYVPHANPVIVGNVLTSDGTKWISAAPAAPPVSYAKRELLTANRTYYVRLDGNNANTGLANNAGGAFLTIQKAIDVCAASLDFGGYVVTVQVGDGTWGAGATIKAMVGMASPDGLIIQGNLTTPSNVVINVPGGNVFTVSGPSIQCYVRGFKIIGAIGFSVLFGTLYWSHLVFGACSAYHFMLLNGKAYFQGSAGYTIAGSAVTHVYASNASVFWCESAGTILLSGIPAFSAFVISDGASVLRVNANVFSGTATGSRYGVSSNSVIFTNGGGVNYLPGNSVGTITSGGVYV